MIDPSRRLFLGLGAASVVGVGRAAPPPPELAAAIDKLAPYFTPQSDFGDVSRGRPLPHKLPDAKKRDVGMHRDTWKLEILSDPEHRAALGKELTKAAGTAFDFPALMEMAKTKAVRFPKIMTCLNLGCPLGMGVWEGVPLRDVLWLAQPKANFRRVMYHGYHNDDPKQIFRSSLAPARVFEDPDGLPPVVLCYKLNGEWLTSERGGPVRIVVPEAYGLKSVKWINTITLSNLAHANDTYAAQNNDVESPLKTFAETINPPKAAKANAAIPVTGYAQVGASGLSKVQVWVSPAAKAWPADDPYFTTAPWTDALILDPPKAWPDDAGKPAAWPMKLTKAYWAALLPGLPEGEYTLRCRTIDARMQAQPMPRPFKKTGRSDIEEVKLTVG
jgi:DMSO/TMAO reductase YedYZ molybdopterin-dependent catalytic subunit